MKKLCLTALGLLIVPSISFAQIAIQDGYSIEGKIFAVKTSKKYGCRGTTLPHFDQRPKCPCSS